MTENLLVVRDLKKYFPVKEKGLRREKRFVRAVDGVSFEMKKGEIMGLVGESGSGKTTVGKTVLNLIEPTGGSAIFDGKTIFDVENGQKISPKDLVMLRQNMQMIFQDPYASLDPRMTVERIIMEGVMKFQKPGKEESHEIAAKLIEECGLEVSSLRKYPHQFSGGQRQRIGIARALSMNPQLIICDEPTAALDVSVQSQILNLMLQLQKNRSMSYLFITHNLGIVEHFCNSVCVMYLGSIVESGPAKDVFANRLHPYTAALFEATPSVKKPKTSRRKLLTGEIPSPANPPSGCKFHPRCEYAQEICAKEKPALKEVCPGHKVACHFCVNFNKKEEELWT